MKKVALITGSSRGIGAGMALQLWKDGYHIVLTSRGPFAETGALEFVKLVEKTPEMTYVMGDISVKEDREHVVAETMRLHGRIDVLCNNAGIAPRVRTDILDVTEESWDEVLDVNLKGTMFMTQLAANIMKEQEPVEDRRGIVINTGSASAWASSVNRAEYCVSKAGVTMLTTVYADRLAEYGIYVYEVRPGVIDTKMTAVVHEKYDNLIARGDFPIARWGTPEDMGLAASCLCEGKLRYSTGEILNIDGGFHIRRL